MSGLEYTRHSFATRVVLQAVHENKNWSTVLLGTSNTGIARNCWGARSCQRSTPCVLKKIGARSIQKHAWLRWAESIKQPMYRKEGELTMVTSGPFPPDDPSGLIPRCRPIRRPSLARHRLNRLPCQSPHRCPIRRRFPALLLTPEAGDLTCRSFVSETNGGVSAVHGTRWKMSSRFLPRCQVHHENQCRHA